MSRIVLHLDMNSYFASVEQQVNPHLRGRPIGVCEHLGGLIIAPSVEAKRLGIKLGTPVWEALAICPGMFFLPTDPPKYRAVTERFNRILMDYSSEIQRYSIDESFIDITEVCGGDYDDALLVGLEIKQRLRCEVGEWISCSVGIGPNKLISKIAADLGRGDLDRFCVVRPEDVSSLYDRLELTDIPGIGKRLERSLNCLGIFTLRQLASYSLANLLNHFGIWGYVLHELGNFQDTGEVAASGEDRPKSIGHAYTLPRVIKNEKEIKALMMKLCEKVGRRMRKDGARGTVISYFHSDRKFHSFHKQRKLRDAISDGREIYRSAWRIFLDENSGNSGIKIMGVTMSGLIFFAPSESLFLEAKKPIWTTLAMDQINDKYGDWTIYPGRLLDAQEEWGKDTVGFAHL